MSDIIENLDVEIIEITTETCETEKTKTKIHSGVRGLPLQLPPCKVCNGKASGIHYGVNSCEACKGFFRRYLSRKEPYVCNRSNNCDISDRPRGNCSACRMQKCLQLGMSKGAVRQGRYTLEERTKAIKAVRVLQGKETDHIEVSFGQSTSENSSVSTENISEFDLLSSLTGEHSYPPSPLTLFNCKTTNLSPLSKAISPGNLRISDEWNSPPSSSPLTSVSSPSSKMQENEKLSQLQTVLNDFQVAYDQFTYPSRKLSDQQLQEKFKEAWEEHKIKSEVFGPMKQIPAEEYNEIFEATGLDIDGRHGRILKYKELWEDIITQYVGFAKAIPGFTSLSIPDQSTLLKAARFEFFMILEYKYIDPDMEVMVVSTGEAFHIEDLCHYLPVSMMKKWFDFARKIKDLNMVQEEMLIVLAICLTFRDRAKLDNPEQVEKIQLNLIEYLRLLLRDHHGDKEFRVFAKIIDMFIGIRAMNIEYLTEFKKMCNDRFLVQTLPEMLEFLFDDT